MSFTGLLCGIIAIYGLLNFAVQPRLTKAWNASRTVSKVAKAGLLGAVEFARDTSLVASVMYVVFALLAVSLNFGFGHNSRVLEWVVGSASGAHEYLEKAENVEDHWFFLIPLALLIYLHWRTQRNRFFGRFERLVDDECDRLNTERANGPNQWGALAPDEQMAALDEQIAQAKKKLATLAPQGTRDRTERRRLLRLLSRLGEQRVERDYERRLNLHPLDVPEDGSGNQPAWQRVLLSRGLFSDLKGLSKILGRVTLATLSLALIGVAGAAGLNENIWNGVIRLDDLRVNARKAEAEERWKEHPGAKQNTTLSDSDRQAIRHLTNDFARALSQNAHWQVSSGGEFRGGRSFRENVGRRAILEQVHLPDAGGMPREAFATGLSPEETEVLRDIADGKANESRVGHIVADKDGAQIKSWFGDRWEGAKSAILEHAKAYHEPIGIDDLQGELIDRVVSAAFDATEPEGASDIVKQARAGMSDVTKEAMRETVETELHRVIEDLDLGKPYSETIEKVSTAPISVSKGKAEVLAAMIDKHGLPSEQEFAHRMAANSGAWQDREPPFDDKKGNGFVPGPAGGSPGGTDSGGGPPKDGGGSAAGERAAAGDPRSGAGPTVASSGGTGESEDSIVSDITRRSTNDGAYSLREESIGALAEYEDHFPRSVSSQASTALGKVLAAHRVDADAPAFAQMADLSVERAASFSMLRGFSKVGGVLIGQDPRGQADIRDIDWAFSGPNVTLTLADAAGHRLRFGPYDRGLVHQSLGYAADGRPVAVTMTIARPVSGLKIFVHPSLVDTPLGCRVQQLDRLVDTYAGRQLPEREKMTEQFEQQLSVYNVALAKRDEAVVVRMGPDSPQSGDLKKEAEAILDRFREGAAGGLKQVGLFADASILRRKPEFFDPSLIRTARSCQKPDVMAFENCVFESYRDSRAVREFKQDVLRTWPFEPAGMEPWSGVRERPYTVDADLTFLKPPAGNTVQNRLWPFDFIVQIAFTSSAVNLPEKEMEKYVDRKPIEFDAIQSRIEDLVSKGIDDHGFRRQFEDLRDFAVLQRLFRAALKGNLGSRFPVLKLAELTKKTADAAPYFHTKRWNSSIVSRTLALAETASLPRNVPEPWMKKAALRLPLCEVALAATIRSNRDVGAAACSFGEFRQAAGAACGPQASRESAGCIWASLVAFGEALPEAQRDEIAFGVLDDERRNDSSDCPPLAKPPAVSLTLKR